MKKTKTAFTLSPDILDKLKLNAPGGNVSRFVDSILCDYFNIHTDTVPVTLEDRVFKLEQTIKNLK